MYRLSVFIVLCFLLNSEARKRDCSKKCYKVPIKRVCASDGIVYRNVCHMRKWACFKDDLLIHVPDGWCKISLETDTEDVSSSCEGGESGEDDAGDDDDDNSGMEGGCRRPTRSPDFVPESSTPSIVSVSIIPGITQLITNVVTRMFSSDSPITDASAEDSTTQSITYSPTTTEGNIITTTNAMTTPIPTTNIVSTTETKVTTPQTTTVAKTTTRVTTAAAAVCPTACPLVLDPVCATDGNTYTSECVLRAEACFRNDDTLQPAYDGPCLQTLQPVIPE